MIQEASVPGFLRAILIILLVYYAFKFVGKYVLPILFKRVVNNMKKKMRDQQEQQSGHENVKVGETIIDKKPKQSKQSSTDVGDYIDYEDVNE